MKRLLLPLLALFVAGFGPAPDDNAFFKAIHKGDERSVRRLGTGKAVFDRDNEGRSPLIVAAQRGHATLVALFLKKKVDVDGRDMSGNTALHHAAAAGHTAIVKALLGAKASLQVYNKRCLTPLDMAAATLRKDVYETLAPGTVRAALPQDGTIEECALKKPVRVALLDAAVAAHRRDLRLKDLDSIGGAFASLAVLEKQPALALRLTRELAAVVGHPMVPGMERYAEADLELRRSAVKALVAAKPTGPARDAITKALTPFLKGRSRNARTAAQDWMRAAKRR